MLFPVTLPEADFTGRFLLTHPSEVISLPTTVANMKANRRSLLAGAQLPWIPEGSLYEMAIRFILFR